MQGSEDKPNKRRVAITSVVTLVLLVAQNLAISEKLLFLIPAGVEIAAALLLSIWASRQISNNDKKKVSANATLSKSFDDDIRELMLAIERAPTKTMAKLFEKQLAQVYQDKFEASAFHRKAIRDEINHYDSQKQLLKAEQESIRADLIQKVEEEVEKSAESVDKPKISG